MKEKSNKILSSKSPENENNEPNDNKIKDIEKKFGKIKTVDDIFCDCGKMLKVYRNDDVMYLRCDCGKLYIPSNEALKRFKISSKIIRKKIGSSIAENNNSSGVDFYCPLCKKTTLAKITIFPPRFGDEGNLILYRCNKCHKVFREGSEY